MEGDGDITIEYVHECWKAFNRSLELYGPMKPYASLFELYFNRRDKILFPGCENFLLSVSMYEKRFKNITTIDSSVAILNYVSRRYSRDRIFGRWQCMYKSYMQFDAGSFNVVIDKGGLDIMLGEPDADKTAGTDYLSEVNRVLAPKGTFAVVTLAQDHVIEVLLEAFRVGWDITVEICPYPAGSVLQPFTVVAKKQPHDSLPLVALNLSWHGPMNKLQAKKVAEAVDRENVLRSQRFSSTMKGERPQIKLRGPSRNLHPGLYHPVELGHQGCHFAVVMDLKEELNPEHQFAVVWIPRSESRARDWQFSTKEGQWHVAEEIKASRLILVHLEPLYTYGKIQEHLMAVVMDYLPLGCSESDVRVVSLDPAIFETKNREEVFSPRKGKILVEDVRHLEADANGRSILDISYRRMFFQKNPSVVQSEALLIEKASPDNEAGSLELGAESKETADEKNITNKIGPSREKREELDGKLQIDYSYLKRPYHQCMVAALVLIAKNLERWINSSQKLRCLIVGLGAGLLPMFLRNHIPFDDITIVELDRKVAEVARKYFGFTEDEQMKLVIEDGTQYIHKRSSYDSRRPPDGFEKRIVTSDSYPEESTAERSGASTKSSDLNRNENPELHSFEPDSRVHVLIVDADSEDPSSRMTCPSKKFLGDEFLLASRGALVEGGVLMVYIVSTRLADYVQAIAQLKKHFSEVFEFDTSQNREPGRVLIALPQAETRDFSPRGEVSILKRLAEIKRGDWQNGPDLKQFVNKLCRLQ